MTCLSPEVVPELTLRTHHELLADGQPRCFLVYIDSRGKISGGRNPRVVSFEGSLLSAGIPPLKDKNRLGSNPRISRFLRREPGVSPRQRKSLEPLAPEGFLTLSLELAPRSGEKSGFIPFAVRQDARVKRVKSLLPQH